MSVDGEVNLAIDVNISNVTDIAKEIANQLNIGKEEKMPTGKREGYKETWLEIGLMKSIVKTMNTNYDEMLSSFESLNKKLQVNVGQELKDILSKGKDMKVDVQNIEALTGEFVDAMSQFITGYDFPQLGKDRPIDVTVEAPPYKVATDYIKESTIVNVINHHKIMTENTN